MASPSFLGTSPALMLLHGCHNATAQTLLLEPAFEGYIQRKNSITLPRLDRWVPNAKWNNVGCKFSKSAKYTVFCEAKQHDHLYCALDLPSNELCTVQVLGQRIEVMEVHGYNKKEFEEHTPAEGVSPKKACFCLEIVF